MIFEHPHSRAVALMLLPSTSECRIVARLSVLRRRIAPFYGAKSLSSSVLYILCVKKVRNNEQRSVVFMSIWQYAIVLDAEASMERRERKLRVETAFAGSAGRMTMTMQRSNGPNSTMEITEARSQFGKLQKRVQDERVIYVTKHGKEAFAVVDVEYLQIILETIEIVSDPESYRMFTESIEDIKNGRVIDHDDLKRELL